jgi:hypothetical protein
MLRRWISIDQVAEYLVANKFRFEQSPQAGLDLGQLNHLQRSKYEFN